MKKHLLGSLFIVTSLFSWTQDVSGFWKGSLTFVGGCFAINNIELQFQAVGEGIYGNSYHYLDADNFIRKDASGHFDVKSKKLVVQEGSVTAQQLVNRCHICVKQFQLLYRMENNTEYLEGFWTGKVLGSNVDCGSGGTIILSRTVKPVFKEEIVPTFHVDTGDVRLSFYDYVQEDEDRVTVLINKKEVLSKVKLSSKPITITTRLTAALPVVDVEMIAEDEGTIPPNTALLEISAGNFFHQLQMSSTKEKNARVRFIYAKHPL